MSFVHDDPDFVQVLRFVAVETRIDPSLVEKDYWVTHCMCAREPARCRAVAARATIREWVRGNLG